MGKRSAAVAVTIAIAATIIGSSATAASATPSESGFVSKINAERRSRGLRALTVKSDLVAVARRHSVRMAGRGDIWHNRNLAREVGGAWTELGENVGVGPDVASLHRAFMQSASHRANILRSSYNQIGIGIAYDGDGMMYVTEVFAKRGSTTVTTTSTRSTSNRTSTAPRSTWRPATTSAPRPAAQAVAAKPAPVSDPEPEPRTVALLERLVGE